MEKSKENTELKNKHRRQIKERAKIVKELSDMLMSDNTPMFHIDWITKNILNK